MHILVQDLLAKDVKKHLIFYTHGLLISINKRHLPCVCSFVCLFVRTKIYQKHGIQTFPLMSANFKGIIQVSKKYLRVN